jgi:hypothetical protein
MCGWRAISLLDKIQENRYYLAGWSLVEELRPAVGQTSKVSGCNPWIARCAAM